MRSPTCFWLLSALAVAVALKTGEGELADVGAVSLASSQGHLAPTRLTPAQKAAQAQQFPEDGGTMLKKEGIQMAQLTPKSAMDAELEHHDEPETKEGVPYVPQSDVDRAIDFTTTSASSRRAGYQEVTQYLARMRQMPASGNGSTSGESFLQDPEVKAQFDNVNQTRAFYDKAANSALHAEKMLELLKEDRMAVVNAAPFRPSRAQKMELNSQLVRLNRAIKHETLARTKWSKMKDVAHKKLRGEKLKLRKLEQTWAKRDGKQKADWLKKLASEHVDFDLWRADNVGQESKTYQKWKATQRVRSDQEQATQRLERIRAKVESKLEQETQKEFTNVRRTVNAAVNTSEAHSIASSIDAMAKSSAYKEFERKDRAETRAEGQYHRSKKKFDRDVAKMKRAMLKSKVANDPAMKRVKLESEDAKVARLKGLVAAGVVQDVNMDRADAELSHDAELSGEQQAIYEGEKAKGITEQDRQQEAKSLDAKVAKAQKDLDAWHNQRAVMTAEIASRVTRDEHEDQRLSGFRLRAYEQQMKLDAIAKVQTLNAKMAALQSGKDSSPGEQGAEMKGKAEIKELSSKVRIAKANHDDAQLKSVEAKATMDLLMRKPRVVGDQATAVLPGQVNTAAPQQQH